MHRGKQVKRIERFDAHGGEKKQGMQGRLWGLEGDNGSCGVNMVAGQDKTFTHKHPRSCTTLKQHQAHDALLCHVLNIFYKLYLIDYNYEELSI